MKGFELENLDGEKEREGIEWACGYCLDERLVFGVFKG